LTATGTLPTLAKWREANPNEDDLIYKRSAVDQERTFLRLVRIFGENKTVLVDGSHRSKSVILPVYHLNMWPGINIWARDNFYNWKVSVDSRFDIHVNDDIFETDEDIPSCYLEGMGDKAFGPHAKNKRRFTIEVYDAIALAILFESIRLSRDLRYQP
jgi:hypothetical protein